MKIESKKDQIAVAYLKMSEYKHIFPEVPPDGENRRRMDGVVEFHVQLPFRNGLEGETFGFADPINTPGFSRIHGVTSLQCVIAGRFFTGTSFEWIAGKKKYTNNQRGYVNTVFHKTLRKALKYIRIFTIGTHYGRYQEED